MITYKEIKHVEVRLDGKLVGIIKTVIGGYQYFPKGSKVGGTIHKTIDQVKYVLEQE